MNKADALYQFTEIGYAISSAGLGNMYARTTDRIDETLSRTSRKRSTKEFIASGHSAVDALNNWSFEAQAWLDKRRKTFADVEWIVPPEFKTASDSWAVYGRIALSKE